MKARKTWRQKLEDSKDLPKVEVIPDRPQVSVNCVPIHSEYQRAVSHGAKQFRVQTLVCRFRRKCKLKLEL